MGMFAIALFTVALILWTGDVSLGRYNKNPRMRVQKAENVNKALEFINSRGVKLTNIGPEGLTWTTVLITHALIFYLSHRHHGWESEAYSWHDLDAYSAFHYRGHQVHWMQLLYTLLLLTNLILQVKKVYRRRRGFFCGAKERPNPTKKWMCKTFPSVGQMALLCSCANICMRSHGERILTFLFFTTDVH